MNIDNFKKLDELNDRLEKIYQSNDLKLIEYSSQPEKWINSQKGLAFPELFRENTLLEKAHKSIGQNDKLYKEIRSAQVKMRLGPDDSFYDRMLNKLFETKDRSSFIHFERDLPDALKIELKQHLKPDNSVNRFLRFFKKQPTFEDTKQKIKDFYNDHYQGIANDAMKKTKKLISQIEPLSASKRKEAYKNAVTLIEQGNKTNASIRKTAKVLDDLSITDLELKVSTNELSISSLNSYSKYLKHEFDGRWLSADYADNRQQAMEEKKDLEPLRKRCESVKELANKIEFRMQLPGYGNGKKKSINTSVNLNSKKKKGKGISM